MENIKKVTLAMLVLFLFFLVGCEPGKEAIIPQNEDPIITEVILSKVNNIKTNEMINLSGSALDPEEGNLNYIWTAQNGLIIGEGKNVTYVAPQTTGTVNIMLQVVDKRNGKAMSSETITVSIDTNVALNKPISILGLEGTMNVSVTTNETNNGPLTYDWFATGGTIEGSGNSINYIAPKEAGEYIISVVMTNDSRERFYAKTNITVEEDNHDPIINQITHSAIALDTDILLDAEVDDYDNDSLTYHWETTGGTIVNNNDGTAIFRFSDIGTYTITLTVEDGQGGTATDILNIAINNESPTINSITTRDTYVNESSTITVDASDPEGDTFTFSFTVDGGKIVNNNDGTATYTAPADQGTYHVEVTVTDSKGGSTVDSQVITVPNRAPAITSINLPTPIYRGDTVTLSAVVNDLDNDKLSYNWSANNGTIINNLDGTASYTATTDNAITSDTITLTLSDDEGVSVSDSVTISFGNRNPIIDNITFPASIFVNESGEISIEANDPDGDTITYLTSVAVGDGTVTNETNQTAIYTAPSTHGSYKVTVTITDSEGATTSQEITISVPNRAPLLLDDTISVNEDGSVLIDVLVNDSDPDGDTLSVSTFTQGINGSVSQEGNSLRYTPDTNYNGSDSFTYDVSDGNGETATATVNVTVSPVQDPPTASDDTISVDEDNSVLIDVLANDIDIDGDILSIASFSNGVNGTVTQEIESLRYTPSADFNGTDSFTYGLSDGNGGSATATVNITVNAINDSPVAMEDNAVVNENDTVLINVLINDTDVDGDTLAISAFEQGTNGTVVQEGDSLRYTPDANYSGADIFSYQLSDGNGGIVMGTVNVTINAAPTATNDTAIVNEDDTVLIDVLANDSDAEGGILSLTGYTQGISGFVGQEGNSLRYTPYVNFNGSDSFTYEISNGNGGTATATVDIAVSAVNDTPTVHSFGVSPTTASSNERVTILIDASDVDGDSLEYRLSSNYYGSYYSTYDTNSLYYDVPSFNFGVDTITVEVYDGTIGIFKTISVKENITYSTGVIPKEINITASSYYPEYLPKFAYDGIIDDGSLTNMWAPSGMEEYPYIIFDLEQPYYLDEVVLWGYGQYGSDGTTAQPTEVLGSNDGVNFTSLGGIPAMYDFQPNSVPISTGTPYRYIKIVIPWDGYLSEVDFSASEGSIVDFTVNP